MKSVVKLNTEGDTKMVKRVKHANGCWCWAVVLADGTLGQLYSSRSVAIGVWLKLNREGN